MPTTSNFGWTTPADTDLVKDGAAAIRTLGNGIDTSFVDLKGGTTGQVLSKNSNTDLDFTWVTSDDANAIQNTIVDAKGDLISASGNDVPARLAVGNDGETLVADSSTSTGLRYTAGNAVGNPVLNSAFQVWQRGTSIAVASSSASSYTADRWLGYRGATGSTVSRQVTNDTTNLPNIQYCARVQRDSGNTSTALIEILQPFETANAIPYAGKTVTLSFYARKGANFSGASDQMTFRLVTGTGTDQNPIVVYSGSVTAITSTATLTTTWQRFSATATLASNVTEFFTEFYYTPSGTAGAADFFEMTGAQIDLGSVALPFRTYAATLAGELQAAQRYYYRAQDSSTLFAPMANAGISTTTTNTDFYVPLPVTMRTKPTSVDFSTLRTYDYVAGAGYAVSAITLGTTSQPTMPLISCTMATATSGRFMILGANNSSSAYLGFSAEL